MKTMKYTPYFILVLILSSCQPQGPSRPAIEHVIVLGVDGMSPSGVQKATTPNLNRVMREGAFTFHARAVLGTSSSQNWASMIMGAGPEQHGITTNGWERNNFSIEPTATGMEDIFPSIFGLVRQQLPGALIASIYDWGGFGRLYEKSAVDIDKNPEGPRETMAVAVDVIGEDLPAFTFIHLDHVDGAGHGYGHGSDEYFTAVELADSLLGNLLAALDAGSHWDNTLLIISADHGGVGTRHGGESMLELEIPWMAMGAGVAAGKQIVDPVDTYDTAATAAFALGLEPPYAWIGRPVTSAFAGYPDHTVVSDLKPFVPAPRLHPPAGMVDEDGLELAATVDFDGAQVRYTLDGSMPDRNATVLDGPMTLTEPTLITARAFTPDGGESAVSRAQYLSPQNGVHYNYYEGDWQRVPDVSSMRPTGEGIISQIDLTAVDKREDHYSVRFESMLQIDKAGLYTFQLISDDGSMLWINGEKLIDTDGGGGARTKDATIDLSVGRHRIEVAYLETYGDNHLNLTYAGPEFDMQPIPARVLFK